MGRLGSSRGADYMRGFTWGMKGEEVVMANLNKELEKLKVKSVRGMVLAAAFIRNKTEKDEPLTPVDYGNLRASWFVTTADKIHKGGTTPKFKGPKAGEMTIEHASTVNEAQGLARMQSSPTHKVLIMGYSANYSGFVHEMIGATNFSRPGSDIKWLETHIKANTGKIVEIIKNESMIPK